MSSLVPCKFFAQGNCRFGNNCRFYHGQQQQSGSVFGQGALAPATFQPGGAVSLSAKSNQNLDIIVEGVKKDMQEWQASKIWPYSCYGPVGGKPCVPGFEDLSTEEFRFAFMQNGNNLPPEFTARYQQIEQLRVNYQQTKLENRNIIEKIATAATGATAQSLFGGQQLQQIGSGGILGSGASSVFGGTGNQQQLQTGTTGSIFGGSFGQSGSSLFQQQQQPSLFQQPTSGGGIFGGGQTQQGGTGIFGQPATGMFGQTPQQPQTGTFQTQPASTGSLFQQPQGQASLFQPQQQQPALQGQSGLFQQQQQPPPTGLFQVQPQQTSGSLFNPQPQQPSQPSLFTSSPNPNPVGQGSIFGGGNQIPQQQQQPTAAAPAQSIFGGTGVPGAGTFTQQSVLRQGQSIAATTQQKFVYSEEADLTPEELDAFKAPDFTIETLPTKPPPLSLCL